MTQSKPYITSTTHTLPFDKLSPRDFERLCLWLVRREGFERAEHLGASGREQGRDIVAWREGQLWAFQCKRVQYFYPADAENEAAKVLSLPNDLRPSVLLFLVSCDVSDETRRRARALCADQIDCQFWALTELDERVKRHPDLLTEFFGLRTSPIGVPFQAPPLPAHFVPRPEVTDDVKDRLLSEDPAAPGVLAVSAIHGLGGIGKSVLAAALSYDPEVQHRFPDGILWVTLGQQPNILSLLAGWIQALGDCNFHPAIAESASSHLRTLLYDKACLLVVDDAWQADHARPFLAGGERCCVLITTRDATLTRKVSARLYDLDVMTELQALALFEARLGALNGAREDAAALAHELGYLPLALALAAAQVESGVSWVELLNAFRQGLADLAALDLDEATLCNESLRLSFRLSLERLSPEDQEAFAWLGVLPEDARLNPAMAATLWDQLEVDARKRLRYLRDKALLKSVGDDQYTVHDLLHHEARLRLAEQMSLTETHTALLARYQQKVPEGRWDRLPDDGYIYEHLTWHMEQAGQAEAIHTLLRLETDTGRNAWYEAREALGQTAGYLDNVRRAQKQAEKASEAEIQREKPARSVGLEARYSLVMASLNSLAESIPSDLLVTLVEHEVWTPLQGLTYIRRVSDEQAQKEALAKLMSHLPEASREQMAAEVLGVAQNFKNVATRVAALLELSTYLNESKRKQIVWDALIEAQEIKGAKERTDTLTALLPHLSASDRDSIVQEALAAARQIADAGEQAKALVALIADLPEHDRASVAREVLAAVHDAKSSDNDELVALVQLVPCLSESLLDEALQVVRAKKPEIHQIEALGCIAWRLPSSERHQVVQEAFSALEATQWEGDYAQALARLAAHLGPTDLTAALEMARSIGDRRWRVYALHKLADHYPQAEQAQIIQEALAIAWEISEAREFTQVMSDLLPHLTGAEREHVLREALKAAKNIYLEVERAIALNYWLATDLSEETVEEAIGIARSIKTKRWQALAFKGIAQRLAELGRPDEALRVARIVGDVVSQAKALAELAPYVPEVERESSLQVACRAARQDLDEGESAEVLARLSIHLPEAEREELLREAFSAIQARGIINPYRHLREMAPYLPWPYLKEALTIARACGQDNDRDWVLAKLAPRAAELGYPEEALEMVREIKDDLRQSEVLAQMAPCLPEVLVPNALTAARGIRDKDYALMALVGLIPHLPEQMKAQVAQEALGMALAVRTEWWQARALARLLPHLSPATRSEVCEKAITFVRELDPGIEWAEVVARSVPCLPASERQTILREALAKAQTMAKDRWRAQTLARLIPCLSEQERESALAQALTALETIERGNDRAEALADLASHLATLSLKARYRLWRQAMTSSARHIRGICVSDLRLLAYEICALGGEVAVAETFRAVQDVGRWWP